jgi:hypothetical protein
LPRLLVRTRREAGVGSNAREARPGQIDQTQAPVVSVLGITTDVPRSCPNVSTKAPCGVSAIYMTPYSPLGSSNRDRGGSAGRKTRDAAGCRGSGTNSFAIRLSAT